MCNLYRLNNNKAEVAQWFNAVDALGGANLSDEVFPGYPGMVVAEGALRQMNWGFPLVMKGKSGQPLKPKPVNNCRTDKLESYFWRDSFLHRRCLIPLTAWAEAQGPKGAKTRTWLSLLDQELFACAGVWRDSDEWGACYSMVMTESAGDAAQIHSRMPVLLAREDYAGWLSSEPDAAFGLCRAWEGRLSIDRTDNAWSRSSSLRSEASEESSGQGRLL